MNEMKKFYAVFEKNFSDSGDFRLFGHEKKHPFKMTCQKSNVKKIIQEFFGFAEFLAFFIIF